MAKWPWEPTQKKDIQNHIHLPWIRQQWLRLKQVADKQWEWSRTNVCWSSVMSVGDNRDRTQPTCGHGTCGCTFWLKFCCFTCIVTSEFAWLLCATALSVLYNHCTESVSCKSIFGLEANYIHSYVHNFIQSVHITHSFKCLNLPVHTVTTTLLTANHCQ